MEEDDTLDDTDDVSGQCEEEEFSDVSPLPCPKLPPKSEEDPVADSK